MLFITSRPSSAGRTVQRQSQRWLQRMGFPLPSVYVVHGSRGAVAQALNLDVVIDDRPDNCLDVVLGSKAGAVLIWRGPQEKVPVSARRLGIGFTKNYFTYATGGAVNQGRPVRAASNVVTEAVFDALGLKR